MAFRQLGNSHKMEPCTNAIINQSPQFVKQCIYTAGERPEMQALSCRQEGTHAQMHALSHTPMLTCTRSPALTHLRFSPVHMHFPGHLSTSLCAHTDLLLTWESQGELSPLIQILSTHVITQAKQGVNSISIQGTVQGSTAHHVLVQLPRAEGSFSTCRHPCCLIARLI